MQTMDFVFVQFYNNAMAGCDIGQPGFIDSFKAWSTVVMTHAAMAPWLARDQSCTLVYRRARLVLAKGIWIPQI